jgi:hypothetical protein
MMTTPVLPRAMDDTGGRDTTERTTRANLDAGGRFRCRQSHAAREGAFLKECADANNEH